MMLNMQRVGSKIAELRKDQNMTQMELADKMQISFQAVSNWERGLSMPDVAKLPELAELFGVTIDELLGQKSQLLESVVQNSSADHLQHNTITARDLAEIAPLLKPEQVDDIFNKARSSFQLSEIVDILPFLSSEIIAQLATSSYEKEGLSALASFAPFLPQDALAQIAEWEYAKHGLKHFAAIAPFLNRNFLDELAKQTIEREGIRAISPIVPFLDRTILSEFILDKCL